MAPPRRPLIRSMSGILNLSKASLDEITFSNIFPKNGNETTATITATSKLGFAVSRSCSTNDFGAVADSGTIFFTSGNSSAAAEAGLPFAVPSFAAPSSAVHASVVRP